MKTIFIISIFVIPFIQNAYSCFTPPRQYSWNDQQHVYCAKEIFIGEFDGSEFIVDEVLKGSAKKGDKKKVSLPNTNNDPYNLLGVRPDCTFNTGFKKDRRYIVFLNSVGKKAYMDEEDPNASLWIKTIKELVSNKNLKTDCPTNR